MILCGGKMHSPLLENNAACQFISASWGLSSHSESRAARGQNATLWCLGAANRRVCTGSAMWHASRPQEQWQPSSEHLFFPCLHGECAIFPHPVLLFSAWLLFVFSEGRCALPSSWYLQGTRGQDGLVRSIPLPGTLLPVSQVSVSSRCCDIMTNTQALND